MTEARIESERQKSRARKSKAYSEEDAGLVGDYLWAKRRQSFDLSRSVPLEPGLADGGCRLKDGLLEDTGNLVLRPWRTRRRAPVPHRWHQAAEPRYRGGR